MDSTNNQKHGSCRSHSTQDSEQPHEEKYLEVKWCSKYISDQNKY